MKQPILVEIIGAPVACADGVKETWREVADWTCNKLQVRFGEAVRLRYYDLFDVDRPAVPDGAELPLVLVAGKALSSGGKISIPAIRRQVERELGRAELDEA
jgi:hypothetical protein